MVQQCRFDILSVVVVVGCVVVIDIPASGQAALRVQGVPAGLPEVFSVNTKKRQSDCVRGWIRMYTYMAACQCRRMLCPYRASTWWLGGVGRSGLSRRQGGPRNTSGIIPGRPLHINRHTTSSVYVAVTGDRADDYIYIYIDIYVCVHTYIHIYLSMNL